MYNKEVNSLRKVYKDGLIVYTIEREGEHCILEVMRRKANEGRCYGEGNNTYTVIYLAKQGNWSIKFVIKIYL